MKNKVYGKNINFLELEFDFDENIDFLKYENSVIVPIFEEKLVMYFDSINQSWEFPKSKSNENENIIQSSIREIFEECGAIAEYIKPIGHYKVLEQDSRKKFLIFIAKIAIFEPRPRWSTDDLVKLFEILPEKLSDENETLYKAIIKNIKAKCVHILL
ncbi:NUDIX domain-containing protein [Senegalia massiliensis]|jgi:ADP-ribose pyrophosphatase YjhB (NUDIX family)|uniref:NUDIX domain-containing protein n=1 Tax=Senegalia massiliensis TaxID=1720316 RepID=UPI0010318036|nr:NUDIX domain-containing protein [Senegalia massiliensis]